MDDKQSLAHMTWNCEYHIVPRKAFYKEKRVEVEKILLILCEKKFISGKRPQMVLLF